MAEISLAEIIKSINSETNNKPPGNDGLTAEFYRHFSNELALVLLGVYDSWESLRPWVLLIKQKSYLPSGPYLGRNTSRKRVGAQNEKIPNRDWQNYFKIGKKLVTLHKIKVKQTTLVGNTYIFYTQTSLKRNFCHKKCFLLVNLFTSLFNRSHQETDICGEKNSFTVSFT